MSGLPRNGVAGVLPSSAGTSGATALALATAWALACLALALGLAGAAFGRVEWVLAPARSCAAEGRRVFGTVGWVSWGLFAVYLLNAMGLYLARD